MDSAYRLIYAFFESVEVGRKLAASEPHLVEARTSLGETPLHYLAVENQIKAVQALVECRAEINAVSGVGGTPLSEAAALGHVELVTYLLSVGACLKLDGQCEPTLHQAATSGSLETVQVILNAGADVDAQNDIGESALHIAARKDNADIVRLLLNAGADINVRRIFDETPIEVARNAGATVAVRELEKAIGHATE